MPRWRWLLLHMTRRLWFRASLIALAGVITAIVAIFAQYHLPWDIPGSIGADAVGDILNIIATSMLSVATFSLSVMITAYDSATSDVTPRATRLLMEDSTTQNVLSTFVGAFLFSIVGIVALKTGLYGDRGRVILFVVTIAVIILIVVSLLRWIDHLTRFGRVGATTARVEEKARHALEERLANPWLGGVPLLNPDDDVPFGFVSVPANVVGHVQHVDMDVLSLTTANGAHPVHVVAPPGTMVYPDSPLAWIAPANDVDENMRLIARARTAFSIGNERDFDQDPRFCLAVLAEIGERALASATNDPGTALDVIGRQTRLLALWSTMQMERVGYVPKYPHVHVPALRDIDLFDDAFTLIARDGAHLIEIQLRLQKSLEALARMGSESFRAAARHQADNALIRAKTALVDPLDRKRLLELVRPADTFATVPPHTEC
ncbi:hypothetical protein AA0472_0949 [Acetobacter estunensis NRIC 0472]|uniref:DUF2254 domain-containing protein n=1 Tax=Acetobacter estunensis TaxID=104097 RepID=A0A967B4I8_9PROT|nr:DUF2254 domain-containing protein [Acetobacter estunensis]NHO52710.1 DUF2254 domain-containing protein [Acetobacter estunensis]GBQ22982.1 hypothetical protein AA0472_0949 [Acetobacter estunensis NRIC 0472]